MRPRVTGYQFWIDEESMGGDGTQWNPLRTVAQTGAANPTVAPGVIATPGDLYVMSAAPYLAYVAVGPTPTDWAPVNTASAVLQQFALSPNLQKDISAILVPIDSWDPWTPSAPASTCRVGAITYRFGGNTLLGMKAPTQDGAIVWLENLGNGTLDPGATLTIKPQSSATPADEFRTPNLEDVVLPVGGIAVCIYLSTHPGWLVLASTNGRYQQVRTMRLAYQDSWQKVLAAGAVNDLGYSAVPADLAAFQGASVARVTSDALGNDVTGMQCPAPSIYDTVIAAYRAPYDEKVIMNTGNGALTLKNNNAGSVNENRFFCPGFVDLVLPTLGVARCIYDPVNQKWTVNQ